MEELKSQTCETISLFLLVAGVFISSLFLAYHVSVLIQEYQEAPSFILGLQTLLCVVLLMALFIAGPFVISRMKSLKEGFRRIKILVRGHTTLVKETTDVPMKPMYNAVKTSVQLESCATENCSNNVIVSKNKELDSEFNNLQSRIASSDDNMDAGIQNGGFINEESTLNNLAVQDEMSQDKSGSCINEENELIGTASDRSVEGCTDSSMCESGLSACHVIIWVENDKINDTVKSSPNEKHSEYNDRENELHTVAVEHSLYAEEALRNMMMVRNGHKRKNVHLDSIDVNFVEISPLNKTPPFLHDTEDEAVEPMNENGEGDESGNTKIKHMEDYLGLGDSTEKTK